METKTSISISAAIAETTAMTSCLATSLQTLSNHLRDDDDDEELVVLKPKATYERKRYLLRRATAQTTEKISVPKGGSLKEKKYSSDDSSPLQQRGEEEEPNPPLVSEFELRLQQKIDQRRKLMEKLGIFELKEIKKKEIKKPQPQQLRQYTKQRDTDLSHLRRSKRLREKIDGRL